MGRRPESLASKLLGSHGASSGGAGVRIQRYRNSLAWLPLLSASSPCRRFLIPPDSHLHARGAQGV
eukprot:143161-Prorocentrum_minimum.AAC.1